jgi:hypothetical protein
MLHSTRVSGWVVVYGTLFEMLLAAQSAVLYYGMLCNDPNTTILAGLAATSSGGVTFLVILSLWTGITINVGNCPARFLPPQAPQAPGIFNSDYTIYRANDGFNWMFKYSSQQWRAVCRVIDSGKPNIPYRDFSGSVVTRDDWERLRSDLVDAGLATRTRGGAVIVNDEGKRVIRTAARKTDNSPAPSG